MKVLFRYVLLLAYWPYFEFSFILYALSNLLIVIKKKCRTLVLMICLGHLLLKICILKTLALVKRSKLGYNLFIRHYMFIYIYTYIHTYDLK